MFIFIPLCSVMWALWLLFCSLFLEAQIKFSYKLFWSIESTWQALVTNFRDQG